MDDPGPRYLHGTDPDEQRRLAAMNDLLNAESLRAIAPRPGEQVMDLGCGPGQLSRAIARAVGGAGRVVAVERSEDQLAEARRLAAVAGEADLVDFRRGPAESPPLAEGEAGTFDLAHARFLLEHVPDPSAVVAAMVAAVRPGGRVAIVDDDHDAMRLWPEPPGFSTLWAAYIRAFDRNGNDPAVGRRLVSLLAEAGARPSRCGHLFFGGCVGTPRFAVLVANLVHIIVEVRGSVVAAGLMPADGFDEAIGALRRWGDRPDAALWYSACWAEAIRPGR